MPRTKSYRKYQLTINNPAEHGFTHEMIRDNLATLSGCLYWCMCDEIGGETGTYHTHVYAAFQNAKEFSAIQRRFYGAHIEVARGSHQENRDYILKEGKYQDDPKHDTNLPETFEESGELPQEEDRKTTQSEAILGMIEAGASDAEILREHPSAMMHLPRLEQARQALRAEQFKSTWRDLEVTYIFGTAGSGKTRYVMDLYGYSNVYRVNDYKNPFDGYAGEDVLLLDEFRSSLPLTLILNVLDGYPLRLPCRYTDRQACFTKVFIVSNIPLEQQYPNIQAEEPESYNAFLRRIHNKLEFITGKDPDFPFEEVPEC